MYFVGIDLGTTSVKIVAADEKGRVLKSVTREYPLSMPKPLWSEQNPEDWWTQTLAGLKEVAHALEPGAIKAISFSGQMHGLVTLDEQDRVVRPAILWNDQRTVKECAYLNETIGQEQISAWTGNLALTGFTAPKVLWLKANEPDNFARTRRIMLPKDYLAYRLSGVFATDYSDASGTLYLDVKNKRWSQEMLGLLEIEEAQLPALYESYDVIGTVRQDLAEELRLSLETKIVIGGGDQAVAAIGGGVVRPGDCSVSLGTSGVVFTAVDQFHVDPANSLHSFCHANGKYHLMGVTLAAAASLKWWVEEVLKSQDYDGLIDEARNTPAEDTLFFLPYLMGERTPHNDPECRGTFIGLNMLHGRNHMTRAVMEGVAFSLRDTFEIIRSMGIPITDISISGGGSASDFWCEMIANVLDAKVNTLNANDGPAYGAAILAAVGAGQFSSVADACNELISVRKTLLPDAAAVAAFTDKYNKYRLIYPATQQLFKALNASG